MKVEELDNLTDRIGAIERFSQQPSAASFEASSADGWVDASRELARALERVVEPLSAFIRVSDPNAGQIACGWTGSLYCVWTSDSAVDVRNAHMKRFTREFEIRLRLWRTLSAALRAALTISRSAVLPLTAGSAIYAAWELAKELQQLSTAISGERSN